ncbi:class F sortase [Dictyobacter kobayashii]|uniref:Class F sortase n=1 Tax=Dictyobacter kobayashii TaxID=2014872 RepID=A0A402AHL4_9CHLR|nr:class F sortase [Dictyobacter kobayashii]GCE18524.1 class F sortase [Dictyobacter kobayashii]
MENNKWWFIWIGCCVLLLLSSCGQTSSSAPQAQALSNKLAITAPASHSLQSPKESTYIPVHIRIPAIGVDANIEPVSILPNSNLDTPHQNPWDSTGWYKNGPRPGEMGSAVIDGHVDRPGGGPAIFWNLRYLKAGDQIIVTTSTDQQLYFHVTARIAYAAHEAPLQTIFGDNSGRYLNLITCDGYWIPSEQQTSARMVVFARLG